MKSILEKFNDGGPVITYVIFLLILVIIAFIVSSLIRKDARKKSISLLASLGWFALAWGYLGRTFGLIMAFDNVAAAGEITPEMMAGGLKMALIGPLMGLSAFLIARAGILILIFLSKKEDQA